MFYGGVGEVVNTPDCGSGMHGFDSHTPPHNEFYSNFSRVYLRSSTKLLFFVFLKEVIVMLTINWKQIYEFN